MSQNCQYDAYFVVLNKQVTEKLKTQKAQGNEKTT